MAEVKKVATRVSYGEALVELGNEHDDFVVLDADLAAAHKIYGRDLTRIPSIGWFADTVGKLIQGRIQNMG